jgi:TolB-like protein/class 3 adenylate cyclase/Flp pilus assembly protein TadD
VAERVQRRLAAILAADVVGYSRLMGEDETGTLEALKTQREDLIAPRIAAHHGRIVKLMGDGLLAEFPSAVEAVDCAVEIQQAIAESTAGADTDRRITYRIGINIGDIIVEGDDIYGDGVNVAARLEALAEAGRVCVSRNVVSQVKGKVDFAFEDLGEKRVKNIAEPVQVYRVLLGASPVDTTPIAAANARSRFRLPLVAAGAALLILLGGIALWQRPWEPREEPASLEAMAFPLPDKPSIAVLPFDNLSGGAQRDYLVDGMTDDIITALSRFRELFVIARNSTFVYKGKPVKIQKVAEDLGVRYVLEGSYREAGGGLRITAQLIDALSGNHIWAESYDRDASAALTLQDEIVKAVVTALAIKVEEAERLRATRTPTTSANAYDLFLRGRDLQLKEGFWVRDVNQEVRRLQEEAAALDPGFARAYAELAWTHLYDFIYNWTDPPGPALQRAFELSRKAISLDPSSARAHYALGHTHLYAKEHDLAAAEVDKAIALNPNDARFRAGSAGLYIYGGEPQRAIELITSAMRLNPNHEDWYWHFLGWASFHAGKYEEALIALKRIINFGAGDHRVLAATYARLDRLDEAAKHAAEVLGMEPDFAVSHFRENLPYRNKDDLADYTDALVLAGLPERPPLKIPDKPSIAVLPFNNLSNDPEQEYFADGMTEDLITDLSKISGLFVIARNSSFSYKGQQVKVQRVAGELGVRYVLEGSVRRAGDQVRINTQLIDALSGGHVWAERYDRKLDNIFAVQDEIIERVVAALELHLTDREQQDMEAGPATENLKAYDLVLQARKLLTRFNRKDAAKAKDLLERAIKLDPKYAEAHSLLGFYYFDEWRVWGRKRDQNLSRALELGKTAAELGPSEPAPQVLLALAHQWRREFDLANAAADRALALELKDAITLSNLGSMLNWANRYEEALELLQKAVRLDPFHPPNYLERLADAYGGAGDNARCVEVAKRGIALDPNYVGLRVAIAKCYGALGEEEEAEAAGAEILRTNPRFTIKAFAAYGPFSEESERQRYVEYLRKAGIPETLDNVFRVPEGHMAGKDIRAVVSGQIFVDTRPAHFIGTTMTFDPSGQLKGYPQAGSPVEKFGSDEGKWWIDGDKFCRKWNRWQNGKSDCFSFLRKGEAIEWINRFGQFHSAMEKLE